MRILLDTNIIIHREASKVINPEIGKLFHWLDRLQYIKCVHPFSINEIEGHKDPEVVKTMKIKVANYNILKTLAEDTPEITAIRKSFDKDKNDETDTSILNEVYSNRIDFLITEDTKIHQKAKILNISHRIFTIDSFLEKVISENPTLSDYKVLSVRKKHFGEVELSDSFFDSFREDYQGFDIWFSRKSDEIAYVCHSEAGHLLAFLYVKIEDDSENYSDIHPVFTQKKRLKISSFKVIYNGYKLGERFLKIIFDNALKFKVEEIYVTIFNTHPDQQRLISLLKEWGFIAYGTKKSVSGEELVLTRSCEPNFNPENPQSTFPFISKNQNIYIVPIYPSYHTELFPDSILNTESPEDYIENKPNRNALKKVYISRSIERDLVPGDLIVFYRTKYNGPAYYTSVTTTIGVVENVVDNITDEKQLIELCRKRSVFSDNELSEHWNYNSRSRPFIVYFLFVYSFPTRLNLKSLIENSIISEAPRGFSLLEKTQFEKLLELSNAEQCFIID